jgi:Bifunctional DNA primase/polymerase, N-terminal
MQSPSRATRRRFQHVLEFARRYLSAGWRLIPNHNIYRGYCTCRLHAACAHPGKHPRIADWSDATDGHAGNDPAIVERWITRWPWLNLGLATGHGLLALDIDPAHGGRAWLMT